MARLCLALAALALSGASALRTAAPQESAGPPQEKRPKSKETGLPVLLWHFNDSWVEKYRMEEHLWDPKPESIRLVLGIMTTLELDEYRTVIRETWINQDGVCYWSPQPKPGCSVYVAFVHAARGLARNARGEEKVRKNQTDEEREAAKREPGMFELDMEENMNNGKSFVWMSAALEKFPWATHIGKMDMDTYPFVHKLLTRMSRNTTCADEVSPYQIIGRPGISCPGPDLYKCTFQNKCAQDHAACLGQYHSAFDPVALFQPWQFALGEMYIFSMPLMKIMSWTPDKGNEDMVMADRVDERVANKSSCAAFRRLDSHVHGVDPVDKRFINDA